MNTYLSIITTILVITQILRIAQNAVSLKRQEKAIKEKVDWIGDVEIQKNDIATQRYVYKLLEVYLEEKLDELRKEDAEICEEFEEREDEN